MYIYMIIKNNEEEYEDYDEWVSEVYINKQNAEKRFMQLIKKYTRIRTPKYNQNFGAYRLEKQKVLDYLEDK